MLRWSPAAHSMTINSICGGGNKHELSVRGYHSCFFARALGPWRTYFTVHLDKPLSDSGLCIPEVSRVESERAKTTLKGGLPE